MATNSGTPIAELDFNQIKNNLKDFLKGQDILKDYDYEGSNLSVLLDVLAYNTFTNNFYSNMAIGEMFIDSAQLKSSVISHCKELNYLPRSYRSPTAKIRIVVNTLADTPAFVTIPKYTKFTTTVDNVSYTFLTDEVLTVTATNGVYSVDNVFVYEGKIETEYFNATTNGRYILSNKRIDTDSIVVRVYESSASGAASSEYVYKANLFDVKAADKVFYLQPAEEDRYEITFGKDVFGDQPDTGKVIEVKYRITRGEDANGAALFSPANQVQGYNLTVTTRSIAQGGAAQESLESIKFYAPKSIQIQDRAVTESDYENLLKNHFAEIQAVSVYGGEEVDPPKYGRVIIAVDIKDSDGVSDSAKEKYRSFLKDRCPLAIEPVVVNPEFLYVRVVSHVYYNNNLSDISAGSVIDKVKTAISTYNNAYLNDFKKNARQSRLSRVIDDSDTAVISNDTELFMILDFIPVLGSNSSFNNSYQNKLILDHPLTVGEDITLHKPAFKSSNFIYQGQTAFLQDNGLGVIEVIKNTSTGFQILNGNIGTVNYETGKVVIRNLNVSSFSGSAIKLYGRPNIQDIIGPKSKILSIRQADIDITVSTARQ